MRDSAVSAPESVLQAPRRDGALAGLMIHTVVGVGITITVC